MKLVNRGYIRVKGTNTFVEWAKSFEDEAFIDEVEANIYLIEEDFFEEEPVLKAYFKKIFLNELEAVTEDDSTYPEITFENFNSWFDTELSNAVFDAHASDLKRD